ncbi:hypothetical protein LUZ60_009409 [Juncus effusus]|nr:hypothetical protein LUZ60_009409 [Juncus effusus]
MSPLPPEEEEEEYQQSPLPFARGGPIFLPELVGPLSSGTDFKASVLDELHCLEFELITDSCSDEEDLSVDDLKVLTDEELFEQALQESLEDSTETPHDSEQSHLLLMDHQASKEKQNANSSASSCQTSDLTSDETPINLPLKISTNGQTSTPSSNESLTNNSIVAFDGNSKKSKIKRNKRKRGRRFDRDTRAAQLEGSYIEKVKQLALLKQKQDEDKCSTRLHSFSGNAKSLEGAVPTFEKIENMRSLPPVKVKARRSEQHIPINYPEVIFSVQIYHKNHNSKTQEFLVTGSQKLAELRDSIYCSTDKLMETAGKHDPSAYFLIENTFYNDTRDPSSADYSKSVIDWLENSKEDASAKWEVIISGGALRKKQKELLGELDASSLPKFESVHMQRARFADLRFRLGACYLYVHQGNCKHTIIIKNTRLIHPEDSQNQADYPLLIFQLRPRQRKCSVCKLYLATKMTEDDKWAPDNPCYFCINCYYLLHYKEDNSLLYPHVVYDYYHE